MCLVVGVWVGCECSGVVCLGCCLFVLWFVFEILNGVGLLVVDFVVGCAGCVGFGWLFGWVLSVVVGWVLFVWLGVELVEWVDLGG